MLTKRKFMIMVFRKEFHGGHERSNIVRPTNNISCYNPTSINFEQTTDLVIITYFLIDVFFGGGGGRGGGRTLNNFGGKCVMPFSRSIPSDVNITKTRFHTEQKFFCVQGHLSLRVLFAIIVFSENSALDFSICEKLLHGLLSFILFKQYAAFLTSVILHTFCVYVREISF